MPIFFISAYREEQVVAEVLDKGRGRLRCQPVLAGGAYGAYPGGAAAFSKFSHGTVQPGLNRLCLAGNSHGLLDQ